MQDPKLAVMFKSGANQEKTNSWITNLQNFFKRHGHPEGVFKIQSHCFRVKKATSMYEKTKDIVRVQKYLGHKKVETTQSYIKICPKDETDEDSE